MCSFEKYLVNLDPRGEGIVNVPGDLPLCLDLLGSHVGPGAEGDQDAEDCPECDGHAVAEEHRELLSGVLDKVLGGETAGKLGGVGQPRDHTAGAASDDSGNHP